MGIFGSISGKQVDEFAKALAQELAKRYPPAPGQDGQKKISDKKLVGTLERIFNRATDFKNRHKLGVYKKARLGNTFRWELEGLGYDRGFVENLTQRLIVYITRKN